jgi:hypothetical protein
MNQEKLFVGDPREITFLREQVGTALALSEKVSSDLSIREDDDFGFMAVLFLYKQMQHAESVLLLVPRIDAGLIARAMIEGFYQICWAFRSPKERAERFRTFAFVHDWRLVQARLKEGIPVENDIVMKVNAAVAKFGALHRRNHPKQGVDPYHRDWRGGATLADMANAVGRELYDGPYAELSDWEHWGVSTIGASITRDEYRATVSSESTRIAGASLLAAFQCLIQTLEIVDAHLSLGNSNEIQSAVKSFIQTYNSFRAA